ncbi:MAG: DNA-3-methyladenine glycosylase, partial [Polyangiaceae bacterium]|nr:DNA-3-methyladenine glycosylase [Polyangiaceae bacterium]
GTSFFDRDARLVARELLGKILRRPVGDLVLAAAIVEAEAYFIDEKGSHASLGRTPSREPLFMAPGTIYMYHSRGGDSLNVSCRGEGNAVLVKSGRPYFDSLSSEHATLPALHHNSPKAGGGERPLARLCAGQALLCRALALKARDFSGKRFDREALYIDDVGYVPERVVVARRHGIPIGRDEHLPYRYVDAAHPRSATVSPPVRRWEREGRDYFVLGPADADPNLFEAR